MSERENVKATPHLTRGSSLADRLRNLGYDVEAQPSGDKASGEIVARRDLGDRVILFVVDAGGRFRIEITWLVGEWPAQMEIAGVPLRTVDRVSRSVDLVGQTDEPERLAEVAAGLGAIVPWAGASKGDRVAPDQPPPLP
jgi:hypothetical protein